MNKTYDRLLKFLDKNKADYRLIDHPPEGRTEIVSPMRGNKLSQAAKCIIIMIKTPRKETKYVLGVVPGDARVNLEAVKKIYNGTYASFTDLDIAEKLAGSVSGTVLPFAFHPDLELVVDPLLLKNKEIYFNAARLDQSMALRTSDYEKLAKPRLENIAEYKKSTQPRARNDAQADPELRRRHTAGHVMTFAVQTLFPGIKKGVGPWTDEGFYQDFDSPKHKLSIDDFKAIEKKMRWIVNKDFKVRKELVSEKEARKVFADDEYKQELIGDIVERGEEISFHNFVDAAGNVVYYDLCAGPHLESTGQVGVFKLMKVAGSYWRGDSTKSMLTRIYGVAFENEEKLHEYEHFLEEAAKRDHRKLGAELDLFCASELVGPGLPMFTPKGNFLREKITSTLHGLKKKHGYEFVWIPHLTKPELYKTSGHWDKFKDDLFHVRGKNDAQFVVKPMNCPHHTQIYASKMRSYRDLPVRYAETTTCYRDEQQGELLGLSRVRSLSIDDTHIFCRLDQIKVEGKAVVAIIREFYTKLGMFQKDGFRVTLSVRDPETPEKYLGDSKNWDKAETYLAEIAEEDGLVAERVEGEAAFYGPKLDFLFRDAIGREWQLSTLQIDFVMPERFGLEYINTKGEKDRPVMLHIAIAGSIERFLSVLIEHFAGAFPAWLAPVQCAVLPVAAAHEKYASEVYGEILARGGRAELFDSTETLGKRIRNAQTQKIPFMLVVGEKEQKVKSVTVRKYGEGKEETMKVEKFLKGLEV